MTGPLSGYRVIDFTTALAGPWAAGILGDLGAEVIKVEREGGDVARSAGTRVGDVSGMFQMANRGKRSIVLDLKSAEGREAARQLASTADVVVQNFRPSVAGRLGLAYEQLREVKEDIIVVAVSGFGSTGPDASRAAFDSVIQAESGICALEAADDGTPGFATHTVVDKITAMAAGQAAVTALLARERGHGGQLVEVPMLDVAVEFLWMDMAGNETLLDAPPTSTRGVTGGLRRFVEVSDGWCSVSVGRPRDVLGVSRALGLDPEEWSELAQPGAMAAGSVAADEFIAAVTVAAKTFTREEIAERLRAEDVTFGVVRDLADLPLNPQLAQVGLFHESRHEGVGRVRQPRRATRFSAYPTPVPGVSPHLGQHTDEILDELGRSTEPSAVGATGASG